MELPVIKNISVLATTPLRRDALAILEAGYEAVLTEGVIRRSVRLEDSALVVQGRSFPLSSIERIFIVAIGKCAVDAASALEEVLSDHITDGVVLDVRTKEFSRVRSFLGTHPFPSEQNIVATIAIKDLLTGLTERDLVLTVISGGGSALLTLPYESDPEGLTAVVQHLWKGGATITEVNTVRKHMSRITGGQMSQMAGPAQVVSLLFSDVPGDDIGVIASGPTVLDATSLADAENILNRYGVKEALGRDVPLTETPKVPEIFARTTNILVVTNSAALEGMTKKATELGYRATIKSAHMEGIARECGAELASTAMPERACFLYAGETTVKIFGDGEGGRNQELALGGLSTVLHDRILLAVASDGWDNTDKAGALVDEHLRRVADEMHVSSEEYLARNDAYHFFEKVGGHIETGKTGINVADFVLLLSGPVVK